jgi:hypothetical protein
MQPLEAFAGLKNAMIDSLPVANLTIEGAVKGPQCPGRPEPVYGGYANGRGEVVLFTKDIPYRVNFKNQILREGPPLNVGAQARYDATEAGEDFEFCNKTFRRLSPEQISDICAGGQFRVGSRY